MTSNGLFGQKPKMHMYHARQQITEASSAIDCVKARGCVEKIHVCGTYRCVIFREYYKRLGFESGSADFYKPPDGLRSHVSMVCSLFVQEIMISGSFGAG